MQYLGKLGKLLTRPREPRTASRLRVAGWALTLGGGVLLIVQHVRPGDSAAELALMISGSTAMIIGVVLLCSAFLSKRTAREDAAYNLGHDIGEAKGEARARRRNWPTVVRLNPEDRDDDEPGEAR